MNVPWTSNTLRKSRSSLHLEILLYFHKWLTAYWFFTSIILYVQKQRMFYYKLEACAWEIIMMMLMPMIDYIRQKLASQGNKTEQWNVLLWSVILTAPLIVGHVFFLRLQYYVLRLDYVLNSIALGLVALEVFISMVFVINFYQQKLNRFDV